VDSDQHVVGRLRAVYEVNSPANHDTRLHLSTDNIHDVICEVCSIRQIYLNSTSIRFRT